MWSRIGRWIDKVKAVGERVREGIEKLDTSIRDGLRRLDLWWKAHAAQITFALLLLAVAGITAYIGWEFLLWLGMRELDAAITMLVAMGAATTVGYLARRQNQQLFQRITDSLSNISARQGMAIGLALLAAALGVWGGTRWGASREGDNGSTTQPTAIAPAVGSTPMPTPTPGELAVDDAWLLELGRAWFTYSGEEAWLAGLAPFLAAGAVEQIRQCLQQSTSVPPVWRLQRTTIVDGPRVLVRGRLEDVTYGLQDRAVHQPEVLRRYGVDLQPYHLGVRLEATVRRELPPDKAQLPGVEVLLGPERVSAQFFIIEGPRALPDIGECGRGVVFVG